jgi:hypothetical protein
MSRLIEFFCRTSVHESIITGSGNNGAQNYFCSLSFKQRFFSSPEPKVQGELLVSKKDAPASVVRRHASTIVFFSETVGQIYFKFGL